MNIAAVITKDRKEGGAFQYALSLSLLLERNRSDKYNFTFFTTVRENVGVFEKHGLHFHYLRWSNIDRFLSFIFGSRLLSDILAKLKMGSLSKMDRVMKKYDIDLVYFLNPSDLTLATGRLNYVFTVWDLCFFDYPEFPEVYINREFERRERLYRLSMSRAVAVITDSEFTKGSLAKRYGIKEEKVIFLPFLPLSVVNILRQIDKHDLADVDERYNIHGKYILYPAQFWPHKNHVYILEGLKLLKEKYDMNIEAVFSGSDKGNLPFVLKKAEEFGIAEQIHYIGFVDDNELARLYTRALALVMPTYFGPTNIPPLEAFAAGCPVLYPDLPGLRDQVKDAALLIDLKDPDSMCRALLKIIEKSSDIRVFIENGKRKIEFSLKEDRFGALKNVFDDYALKLKTRR